MNNRRNLIGSIGASIGGAGILSLSSTAQAQVLTDIITVSDYQELESLTLSDVSPGNLVKVTEENIFGDFIISSGTIPSSNGGTLFKLQGNLYANRLFEGAVNVKWFGAFWK